MSVDKAKSYYIGQEAFKRMNCAQSIICAFKEKFNLSDDDMELFGSCGAGKAPEGLCGAFYAARYILENSNKGDLENLEKFFLEHAGSLKCRDIRGLKKLSCVGCVEKSAEFLTKLG